MSLDSWFVPSQITQTTNHSIVMRGRTVKYDIPVALKCHTTMSNDARQLIAAEPLMYEILMYKFALTTVSDADFFVPSFGTVRRRWRFADPSAVASEGLGPADAALLRWMLGFTYASLDELNAGAIVLVMRDHGPTSAWRYFSRRTREGEADVGEKKIATFVVQMVGALEVMERAGIVHGDLRWGNVLYPRVTEKTYFDLQKKKYEREWKNFHCVAVDRVVKIFDWDHAFFSHMPSHAKRKAQHSFLVTEKSNMKTVYDAMGFFRLLHFHFPGTFWTMRTSSPWNLRSRSTRTVIRKTMGDAAVFLLRFGLAEHPNAGKKSQRHASRRLREGGRISAGRQEDENDKRLRTRHGGRRADASGEDASPASRSRSRRVVRDHTARSRSCQRGTRGRRFLRAGTGRLG